MKMSSCFAIAAIMSLFFALANTSYADPIIVSNFSFEDPVDTGFNSSVANDWNVTTDTNTLFGTHGGFSWDDDGSQSVILQINNGAAANTSISATTTVVIDADPFSGGTTISAGLEYTLTVAVGHSSSNPPDDILIELLSDGAPFASATLLNANGTITANSMMDLTTGPIVGTDGGVLTVRLTQTISELATGGHQGVFDNVRLVAVELPSPMPSPEPSTFILAALGVVGLALRRRRRRR